MRYKCILLRSAYVSIFSLLSIILIYFSINFVNASNPELLYPEVTEYIDNELSFYNFSIIYKDLDNDYPVYVQVIIDNNTFLMNLSFISDTTNYRSGVTFYYNTSLPIGDHFYYFFVNNSKNETVRLPSAGNFLLTVRKNDSSPFLENPSIDPMNPKHLEDIYFNVTLSNIPVSMQTINSYNLFIEFNTNLAIPNYFFIMSRISISNSSAKYSRNISLEEGSYQYRFVAFLNNNTIYLPSNSFYSLTINGSSSLPYLSGGQFFPLSNYDSENINFSITYFDPLDIRYPHEVKLFITNINNDSSFTFLLEMYGDSTPGDGIGYEKIITLPYGNYSFYFYAIIGNYTTRYPEYNNSTINISLREPSNNHPILSYGYNSPEFISDEDVIYFYVKYSDIENDSPKYIVLNIKKHLESQFSTYIQYNMSWDSEGYSQGIWATYNSTLQSGFYSYFFSTVSNKEIVRYPETSDLYFFIESNEPSYNKPILYNPIIPSDPIYENSTINISIKYLDEANRSISHCSLIVKHSNYIYKIVNMEIIGTNYSKGAICYAEISLFEGYYDIQILIENDMYSISYPNNDYIRLVILKQELNDNMIISKSIIKYNHDNNVNITNMNSDIYLELLSFKSNHIEIGIHNSVIHHGIMLIEIDEKIFNNISMFNLNVHIDNIIYQRIPLISLLNMTNKSYFYSINHDGGNYHLYLYLPYNSSSILSINNNMNNPDKFKLNNTLIVLIILSIILTLIFIPFIISIKITSKKSKIIQYYNDFDIDEKNDSLVVGKIKKSTINDPDWNDFI